MCYHRIFIMSKSNDDSVQKKILNFMIDQNRPFSTNDILSSVSKDIGKTAVIRTLDLLISKHKIKEKSYGKQKVYYVDQNVFADTKNIDVQKLDCEIAELTGTLNGLEKQINITKDMLKNFNNTLTTEGAEIELRSLNVEIPILKDKLHCLDSDPGDLDPEKIKKMCEKKEVYLKEYKRRKRMANGIIDAILEGYPKSKKQLLDEMGIELDGDLKL